MSGTTRTPDGSAAEVIAVLEISSQADHIICSREAMRTAEAMGFGAAEVSAIGISVSELVTNVVKYAGKGRITLHAIEKGLEIIVEDSGPGIEDPELALVDGYSEGRMLDANTPRVGRRGLGSGLGAVKRLMDSLTIENRASGGLRVVTRKLLRGINAKVKPQQN
jgi:serine/threonine-protein kinase RsbT